MVNGTDGIGVEGLTVVLHENRTTGRSERTAKSGADGGFRFDVSYDSEVAYGVSVTRLGALYGANLDLSGGSPEPVSLTVYDATSDDSLLQVGASSLLISSVDGASETVWALEIVQVLNESDLAYIPGPDPMSLLRFGLPKGARELQVDTSLLAADVLQVDRGFALTAAVPPGQHDVMFAYNFPYSGDETFFDKTLRYGASNVRVLAPVELADLAVDGLDGQRVSIGGREYTVYEGDDVPRGAVLSVALGGLPRASLSDRVGQRLKSLRLEYLAPAALGVILAAILGFAVWRRRGVAAAEG